MSEKVEDAVAAAPQQGRRHPSTTSRSPDSFRLIDPTGAVVGTFKVPDHQTMSPATAMPLMASPLHRYI